MQRGTSRREDVLDTVIQLKRPKDYEPEDGGRFEVHFTKHCGFTVMIRRRCRPHRSAPRSICSKASRKTDTGSGGCMDKSGGFCRFFLAHVPPRVALWVAFGAIPGLDPKCLGWQASRTPRSNPRRPYGIAAGVELLFGFGGVFGFALGVDFCSRLS